jgi:hypothetical protein
MQRRAKNYAAVEQFLWSDLPDAADFIVHQGSRLRTPPEALSGWVENGYAILEGAVADGATNRFLTEVHAAIATPGSQLPMTYWDEEGHHYDKATPALLMKHEAKVLDLHTRLASAADLIFAPRILDFLRDIFQDDAVAFQSLYFEFGSQQGAHQDTAFVYTDPPYHFAASWIALEDAVPGAGELFYYPGSQRLDDLIFADGTKALRPGDPAGSSYSKDLEQIAVGEGLQRKLLHIRSGDALLWAADLIHGGAPIRNRHTRRSLVTHYCRKSATVPYVAANAREIRCVRSGAWVVGAN